MKTRVSVVIPNYNGKEYLENCIDSLMNQTVRAFEIIVVDDCSQDDSLETIMKKYPSNGAYPLTRYIRHDENKGFCVSVNDGIKAAAAPFVFLLNNDTVVEKNCIRELFRLINRDENIFSVQAKLVSLQNKDVLDDGGDYYNALGMAFAYKKDKPSDSCNKRRLIFASCGGAAMYRRTLLEEIGLFDENHFAYLEDIDIGYRAKLYGYVNVFEPNAVVYHAGSAASGSRYNAFKAKLSAQNSLYVAYKNMPNWQLVVNSPYLFVGFMMKIFFYLKKDLGREYLEGLKSGFELIRSEKGKVKRADFEKAGVIRCVKLEIELIINVFRRVIN